MFYTVKFISILSYQAAIHNLCLAITIFVWNIKLLVTLSTFSCVEIKWRQTDIYSQIWPNVSNMHHCYNKIFHFVSGTVKSIRFNDKVTQSDSFDNSYQYIFGTYF